MGTISCLEIQSYLPGKDIGTIVGTWESKQTCFLNGLFRKTPFVLVVMFNQRFLQTFLHIAGCTLKGYVAYT